jgi:hypothetical protein
MFQFIMKVHYLLVYLYRYRKISEGWNMILSSVIEHWFASQITLISGFK